MMTVEIHMPLLDEAIARAAIAWPGIAVDSRRFAEFIASRGEVLADDIGAAHGFAMSCYRLAREAGPSAELPIVNVTKSDAAVAPKPAAPAPIAASTPPAVAPAAKPVDATPAKPPPAKPVRKKPPTKKRLEDDLIGPSFD